jgi:hypothetical protein
LAWSDLFDFDEPVFFDHRCWASCYDDEPDKFAHWREEYQRYIESCDEAAEDDSGYRAVPAANSVPPRRLNRRWMTHSNGRVVKRPHHRHRGTRKHWGREKRRFGAECRAKLESITLRAEFRDRQADLTLRQQELLAELQDIQDFWRHGDIAPYYDPYDTAEAANDGLWGGYSDPEEPYEDLLDRQSSWNDPWDLPW